MPLNAGQKTCRDLFKKWYRDPYKQTFELSGGAGVGKTYTAEKLIHSIGLESDEVLCMAYTGKAASNLSLNGLSASSIHSKIYEYIELPKLDENGDVIYKHGRKITTPGFRKRDFLPKNIKLLVVDECYFVNENIAKDLLSFGIPVLALGDMEQLPPIEGKPFFLNNPDYVLTELMRQAKNSGIVELATRIRLGQEIPNKKYRFKDDCFIIPKSELTDKLLLNSDIILCATNRTRNYYNQKIRHDILGITAKLPTMQDKLICRNNIWNRIIDGTPLVNGTIMSLVRPLDVTKIDAKKRTAQIDARPDYVQHDYYEDLTIDIDYFMQDSGGDKSINIWNKSARVELGFALSCHLSQGSGFDSVLYHDDAFGDSDFRRKLRYTAATRAKKLLIYAV